MKKVHTIHYYDFFNQIKEDNFTIFSKIFSNGKNKYSFTIDEKSYAFEILEIDNSHIFGKLSRDDDYKESLTTIKKKGEEIPIDPAEYIFEKFTFFYIKISELDKPCKMSAITNISLNIVSCFVNYLLNYYDFMPYLIAPELDEKIYERLDKLSIQKLDCTFSDMSTHNNRAKFNSLFGWDCFLKNVSLKIRFKSNPKNMSELLRQQLGSFKSLKLEGRNQKNERDIIDLVKVIFTRKSIIEMKDISTKNFEPIKKALNNFNTL